MNPSLRPSIALIATAVFFLLVAASVSAQSLSGSVVAIADGDTISVRTDEVPPGLAVRTGQTISVRLEGIDAPEHGQSFGDASRQHLSALVYGKQVNLNCQGPDRYDRWGLQGSSAERRGRMSGSDRVWDGVALQAVSEVAKRDRQSGLRRCRGRSASCENRTVE